MHIFSTNNWQIMRDEEYIMENFVKHFAICVNLGIKLRIFLCKFQF